MGLLDTANVIGTDLVAKTPRATVDQDDDILLAETVGIRDLGAEDVGDALDLEEVIARPETS